MSRKMRNRWLVYTASCVDVNRVDDFIRRF